MEKETATHSSVLAWRIPGTGEPGGLPSMGRTESDMTEATQQQQPQWFRQERVCLQCGRPGFNPWVGKIPWRRKWQPTPEFLPGGSHGQRRLAGHGPCIAKSWTRLSDFTFTFTLIRFDFPGGSDGKESAYNAGDPGSIPGLGRFPGEGNGNPLQDYCLENPMDRGAW